MILERRSYNIKIKRRLDNSGVVSCYIPRTELPKYGPEIPRDIHRQRQLECWALETKPLPARLKRVMRFWFSSPGQVNQTMDFKFLQVPGIGEKTVAALRESYPYQPRPHHASR